MALGAAVEASARASSLGRAGCRRGPNHRRTRNAERGAHNTSRPLPKLAGFIERLPAEAFDNVVDEAGDAGRQRGVAVVDGVDGLAHVPGGLLALTISAFAIGTTEFVIVGLIPTIATDLGVSLPSAGLLASRARP
ncbi:hypothetical protein EV699_110140 [Plasticicumulans lactativorans]|uniref:MFS transporter n=1 Tax=Plasticicumulans lactativorans TaxID=1133106 RepID=A0A4R2L3L8_9GAMM|nr:hypothetical protein EV699_110140 [Plasticicumulans lactativorans]